MYFRFPKVFLIPTVLTLIKPINDEEPKIEHSRWRVREGDLLNLDESLLNCYDMDIPEDELTFIVIDPPKHGRMIYLGGNTLDTTESIDSFTCMQLKARLRSFRDNFKNIKNSNGTYRAEK